MSNGRHAGRATSLDVAQLAGLSRTTVSQILNGRDARFPQRTRDRVAAAAAQLGYRPSRAGRALVSGVSDLIIIVIPNVTFGSRLQETVEQIIAESTALGMNALVRYAGADLTATVTTILDLRPAAVFHLGALDVDAIEAIEESGTVVLPRVPAEHSNAMAFDHVVGHLQTTTLLEVPGRRIVCATLDDPRIGPFGAWRAEGVTQALAERGLPPAPVVRVPLDLAKATKVLTPVLASDTPLGVCCYNDDVAIAVVGVAQRLGFAVPGEVAVVGVDRTPVGQLVSPRLTTVAVNVPELEESFVRDLKLVARREAWPAEEDPADLPDVRSFLTVVPGETA